MTRLSVEFDPDKDAANRAKHGVSLALARSFELDAALVDVDDRHDYGETRFRALGPIADRIFVLVFTMRGQILRAISLRKANRREVLRYVDET